MGDVAQILAGAAKSTTVSAQPAPPPPPPPPPSHALSRATKMTGLSREVMDLLGGGGGDKDNNASAASLPPIMPTAISSKKSLAVKIGNRLISSAKPARKWVWASFQSSARSDNAQFKHWVPAEIDYPDYPYARFDVHLDPVTYTTEQYRAHMEDPAWTKSETDKLMELARIFELRWAVIHDRWMTLFSNSDGTLRTKFRHVEDLQHRYYTVASIMSRIHVEQAVAAEVASLAGGGGGGGGTGTEDESKSLELAAANAMAADPRHHQPVIETIGTGSTNKQVFDLQKERESRAHLDALWYRSKEEELEEAELRKELRLVEMQLRKLKKGAGHAAGKAAAAAAAAAAGGNARSSSSGKRASATGASTTGAGTAAANANFPHNLETTGTMLDQSFASTAPTPMPGTPYLQSARLVPPSTSGGSMSVPKNLMKRTDQILKELKVPENPLATKRNCDMFDAVRRDALTLLILEKIVLKKETDLELKRRKYNMLSASRRQRQQQQQQQQQGSEHGSASSSAGAASSSQKGTTSKSGSTKGGGGSRGSVKARRKSGSTDASSAGAGTPGSSDPATAAPPPKKSVKRKKKAAAAADDAGGGGGGGGSGGAVGAGDGDTKTGNAKKRARKQASGT